MGEVWGVNNFSTMSLKYLFLKQLKKITLMVKKYVSFMVDILFYYLKNLNSMNAHVTIDRLNVISCCHSW